MTAAAMAPGERRCNVEGGCALGRGVGPLLPDSEKSLGEGRAPREPDADGAVSKIVDAVLVDREEAERPDSIVVAGADVVWSTSEVGLLAMVLAGAVADAALSVAAVESRDAAAAVLAAADAESSVAVSESEDDINVAKVVLAGLVRSIEVVMMAASALVASAVEAALVP